jgi:hypothetical protein
MHVGKESKSVRLSDAKRWEGSGQGSHVVVDDNSVIITARSAAHSISATRTLSEGPLRARSPLAAVAVPCRRRGRRHGRLTPPAAMAARALVQAG